MKKKLTILFSFLLIGLLLNGQSLEKLKNGVLIKGNQYFDNEFNIEFQTFTLDSVIIDIAQIFRKEFDGDNFNCKAIIQTTKKNRIIDELYFENIEPVGSSYGICFNEKQPNKEFLIGSKYGDYSGEIIIIDQNGKVINESGGDYFLSANKRYVISDWYSDLSGITVFNFETNKVVCSKELPVYLSKWYENAEKYYAAKWSGNKENDDVYEFDLDCFSFKKTELNLDELHQLNKVINNGCKPN